MYFKKSGKDISKFKSAIIFIITVSLILFIGFGVSFFTEMNPKQSIEQEEQPTQVQEAKEEVKKEVNEDAEREVPYQEIEEIGKIYRLCEEYDNKGELVYKTTYDKGNRQLSYADTKGLKFELEYDNYGNLLNRLEHFMNASGELEQRKINLYHYEYDVQGKMREKTEFGEAYSEHENVITASYKYEYDTAGNQIKEYSYNADGELRSEEERIYDAEGIIKSAHKRLYVITADRLYGCAVSKYDEAGELEVYLQYNDMEELIYSQKNRYEQNGRVHIQISETYADSRQRNIVPSSYTTRTVYDYDLQGNIAAEYVYIGEELQYSRKYELDEDGNEMEYSYDGKGKLMFSIRTKYLE